MLHIIVKFIRIERRFLSMIFHYIFRDFRLHILRIPSVMSRPRSADNGEILNVYSTPAHSV